MGSTGRSLQLITEKQGKTLKKIANQTRNLKNEQYRVVDDDGNVLLKKQGKEHQVTMTVGESRQTLPNAISIHNHPSGGTFSTEDLNDFGYGAKAIVASAPEGDYMLENLKMGTKNQYNGWLDMRNAMESEGVYKEWGVLELRNEARKAPHLQALREEQNKVTDEWYRRKQAGASSEELSALVAKSDRLGNEYSKALQAEERRLEVEPVHTWLKQNAGKYGFRYTFTEKK